MIELSVSMVEIIKALRILVFLICQKVFRKELIISVRLLLLTGWALMSLGPDLIGFRGVRGRGWPNESL